MQHDLCKSRFLTMRIWCYNSNHNRRYSPTAISDE